MSCTRPGRPRWADWAPGRGRLEHFVGNRAIPNQANWSTADRGRIPKRSNWLS